jgi:hypothetical protein
MSTTSILKNRKERRARYEEKRDLVYQTVREAINRGERKPIRTPSHHQLHLKKTPVYRQYDRVESVIKYYDFLKISNGNFLDFIVTPQIKKLLLLSKEELITLYNELTEELKEYDIEYAHEHYLDDDYFGVFCNQRCDCWACAGESAYTVDSD